MPESNILNLSRLAIERKVFFLHLKTLVKRTWSKSSGRRFMRAIRFFIMLVQVFGAVAIFPRRTRIIASAYCWFRAIDDIIDNEAPTPPGESIDSYVSRIANIIDSLPDLSACTHELRDEDVLLLDALRSAKRLGFDLRPEIQGLWSCMLWDYRRRNSGVPQHKADLLWFASRQDMSILSCCIKILGGNVSHILGISDLNQGLFTRIDWLVDLYDDLSDGIINIPQEAITCYQIDLDTARSARSLKELRTTPGIEQWYAEEFRLLSSHWSSLRLHFKTNLCTLASSRLVARILRQQLWHSLQSASYKAAT